MARLALTALMLAYVGAADVDAAELWLGDCLFSSDNNSTMVTTTCTLDQIASLASRVDALEASMAMVLQTLPSPLPPSQPTSQSPSPTPPAATWTVYQQNAQCSGANYWQGNDAQLYTCDTCKAAAASGGYRYAACPSNTNCQLVPAGGCTSTSYTFGVTIYELS